MRYESNLEPGTPLDPEVRQSRTILLPPVLARNPYFVHMLEAFDEVWDKKEHELVELSNLRNPRAPDEFINLMTSMERTLDAAFWPRSKYIKAQLGEVGLFDVPVEAQTIVLSYIARYWRQKQRHAADFAEFCGVPEITTQLLYG